MERTLTVYSINPALSEQTIKGYVHYRGTTNTVISPVFGTLFLTKSGTRQCTLSRPGTYYNSAFFCVLVSPIASAVLEPRREA